ncbi:lantibiotic dehydratase [Actinoplanes siamensis]|uniref:Lantibiotic dehydratase n=1 Tax=Actinoplanes siamensis TaxID=1223317 RepID=A0A919TKR7_9ACTN|nr:lantibiotic dehydratase [Actinoplanes siamensis]GIF05440.1 lantibiotic dehydratase [Actinoplanes siamensis]
MTGWTLGGWFVLRHAGLPFDWIERLGADEHLLRAADEVLDAGTATDATARYERAYAEAYRELERELHRLAAEPLVEEAVFVSAPDMWRNVWRRYVSDTEPATTSDARRTHRKVYTYLQRFCAKNETTSFFGPLGYGEVDAAADGPGARLCRDEPTRRLVYFAHWAVVELARVMRRDRALLPALPVAVAEPERLSGVAGGGATGKLAADLCDGGTPTVGALAARHGGLGTTLRALAPLLHSGVAELGPLYAGGRADEFDRLRAALAELDSGEAADRWVRRLADLDRLREEYRTTGFPDRVSVLDRLEARFTEVTGQPARRGGGIYADRYVVYEECRSPFRLTIGGAAAARLTDAVQAALTFSAAYGDLVQRRHRAWVLERWPADRATMPLPEYAERLCGDGDWSTRFDAGVEVPRPPPAPLPGPRYALPDICLAARTVDDLAAGRFDVVVARVHHHLLLDSWLAVAHPDPAEFARPAATWVRRHAEPAGLLGAAVSRRNKGFYVYPGEQVALRHQRAVETAGAGPLRPASTFTVTREPDGPRLRDAAGRERRLYLPLADLTGYPPLAALSAPPVLHARFGPAAGAGAGVGAVAEVRLDGAVYQRRRWHVEAPGARGLTPAARFLAVRRLVRQYGLPRFVYVRSDRDRKPYLLDTCSPLAVELFAHRSRPGEHVQLEQMSPGADQLWLTDAAGRRYTCELRMPAFTEGGAGP